MLNALLAAYVIDVKAVSLRRERKQIKVIRKIGFHYRILASRKVMPFVGKNSVAADKKIKTQAVRNGSQLFEKLLTHASFIYLVKLFVTPG